MKNYENVEMVFETCWNSLTDITTESEVKMPEFECHVCHLPAETNEGYITISVSVFSCIKFVNTGIAIVS